MSSYVDEKIGYWPGDKIGDQNPAGVGAAHHKDDTRGCRPEYLPYADFFGPHFGRIGGQSKKPQTRDENGKEREIAEDHSHPCFGLVEASERIVQKSVFYSL
jgi:hypothetical protein